MCAPLRWFVRVACMRRSECWNGGRANPVKGFTSARKWPFRRRRATRAGASDEVRRGYARGGRNFARAKRKKRSRPISGILLRPSRAMTVIPLGRALPRASSHLPADSVGHVVVCLLGVAPRRDWPFHPDLTGYVSVPLILASRRTGVTRYAARWSPDFPLRGEPRSDRLACFAPPFYPSGTSRLGRKCCVSS